MSERHVVWFSCGAASACLAKIVTAAHPDAEVVYCDLSRDEHPDNARFLADVEKWIGKTVTIIRSTKYASVDDVFAARRYMSGIAGAPCTVEMKKVPRFAWQQAEDIHYFGIRADETHRVEQIRGNNPELRLAWPLIDRGYTRLRCLIEIERAGIVLPEMYRLGYPNNNCRGCVKATSASYWLQTRRDFPDVFAQRAARSRELGCRLTRWKGRRVFLDELPPDAEVRPIFESVSCGPECATVIARGEERDAQERREENNP